MVLRIPNDLFDDATYPLEALLRHPGAAQRLERPSVHPAEQRIPENLWRELFEAAREDIEAADAEGLGWPHDEAAASLVDWMLGLLADAGLLKDPP